MPQTSHLVGPHASPPISSSQQIQLTNVMLRLQKAKQLWKTDQVPWNATLTEGPGRPPSRQLEGGGWRGEREDAKQDRQMLPTQAAQESHLGSFENYPPASPDTDALADSAALGQRLDIRIF